MKFPLPLLHKLQTRRGADNFSAQCLGARAVQNPLVSSIQTLVDALLATSVGAVPNTKLLDGFGNQSFIERNPVRFWQGVSLALVVVLVLQVLLD